MANEILLYGEVGVDFTSVDVKTQLAQMDQDEELVCRIDSPGGSVFQGFSIAEAIRQYPGPKRAVVESAAFSIASYILTAFDDVAIASNGYVMIHNPAMPVDGDDEDHAKASIDLQKFKSSMIEAYAAKLGTTPEDVSELMKAETYFNADEAVAVGFANQISEPAASRVVATAKSRSLPTSVRASLSEGSRGNNQNLPQEKPMADSTKRVAATVKQIKAIFPKAKSDFIVRCMEKEMSAEEVLETAMEELQSQNEELQAENEELQSKLKAMEEEYQAKAEEEEQQARAEEEEQAKAEEEEQRARAKARAHRAVPVAKAGTRQLSAKARWDAAVAAVRAEGVPAAKVVVVANRRNPGLRAEMLAEINGR